MKRTHLIFLITLFGIFLLQSCGNDFKSSEATQMSKEYFSGGNVNDIAEEKIISTNKTSKKNNTVSTSEAIEIPKQIIKTAEMKFGVKDYKKSKQQINKLVKEYKGFISTEDEHNSSYNISNTIIIRVEQKNFEALLESLSGEADKMESKSVHAVDVTEEFIDIQKRLDNKRKYEAQYLELLKKAKSIDEILRVNEYIRALREEIEAKEGRLKYLKNQVGLSTITLYIHQDYDTVSYGFFHKITKALEGGWNGLLIFIIGIVTIWPFWIIVGIVIILIKKALKKRKLKKLQGKE